MKKLFKLVSVLLVFCMLFSFAACTGTTDPSYTSAGTNSEGNTDNPATDTNKYADIAGEYFLDATDLGMAMKWYIKITADGKFVISTARDYSAVKGEGTVGDKDGTYMFVYSDNTADNPKTATFKFEGKNMVFSTKVPIGAASVSPSDDGTVFPTAVLIAHEELLGSYYGSYTKESAMAGTVVYDFQLDLTYGSKYTFASSFTMGTTSMTRTETGTFDVNGKEISFTALDVDGEKVETPAAVKGSIEDKVIKAAFKLSMMASAPQEIEAKFGTHSEWAGTYTAAYEKTMGMGAMSVTIARICTLKLDAFGGYTYTAVDMDDPTKVEFTEAGTYTVADGKLSFKSSADGASAVEGAYSNYVLTTKFPISKDMPSAVELSFYAEEASGDFVAKAEKDGKSYVAALSLSGDKFGLAVGPLDADKENYYLEGTFKIEAGMVTKITFTTTKAYETALREKEITNIPAEVKTFSLPIAESGINGELIFDLDDTATVVFQFTHDMSAITM